MFRLDGKVALVTGGSRGIGRACATALAAQGARVVITWVANEGAANEAADAIRQTGSQVDVMHLDTADMDAAEAAIAAKAAELGRLDVLVANAGIAIDGLVLRIKEDDLDRMFAVNVKGAIGCARAALKPMMKARQGRIIFLSSVVGEVGNVGQAGYAATKAALLGLSRSMAKELASRNITVNAVAPGFISTDMTSTMNEKAQERIQQMIPLGRTGTAAEVAAAVAFLSSDEASYVTGQTLGVNGGMHV